MASRLTSNSAAELILRNKMRKSFVVQNEDASLAMFLKRETGGGLTVSTTDHDHRIGPGAAIALNNLTDGQAAIQDRWTIIAESGTPRVSFFETTDLEG